MVAWHCNWPFAMRQAYRIHRIDIASTLHWSIASIYAIIRYLNVEIVHFTHARHGLCIAYTDEMRCSFDLTAYAIEMHKRYYVAIQCAHTIPMPILWRWDFLIHICSYLPTHWWCCRRRRRRRCLLIHSFKHSTKLYSNEWLERQSRAHTHLPLFAESFSPMFTIHKAPQSHVWMANPFIIHAIFLIQSISL